MLVVAEDDRVARVDPRTGQSIWSLTMDEEVLAATSLAGRVYLHLAGDRVVALDASSGAERRRITYPTRSWSSRHVFDASLVSSDRSLFLLAEDGRVLVLDPELRRRRVLTDVVGLYAEAGVVLALHGEAITRLDDLSGAPRWRYDDADFWHDAPSVAAGAVYLGGDEQVVAVDAETGASAGAGTTRKKAEASVSRRCRRGRAPPRSAPRRAPLDRASARPPRRRAGSPRSRACCCR